MAIKLFYLGERHNPQFKKPYYVKYGQLSKTEAKRKEKCVYGSMYITSYNTQQEYEDKIQELKKDGFNIQ